MQLRQVVLPGLNRLLAVWGHYACSGDHVGALRTPGAVRGVRLQARGTLLRPCHHLPHRRRRARERGLKLLLKVACVGAGLIGT